MPLQVVSDPGQADFVLAHGTEVLGQGDGSEPVAVSIADMEALLKRCKAVAGRQVPMIVANPDLVTVDGAQLRVMPGSLARFYQSIGGEVSASLMLELAQLRKRFVWLGVYLIMWSLASLE